MCSGAGPVSSFTAQSQTASSLLLSLCQHQDIFLEQTSYQLTDLRPCGLLMLVCEVRGLPSVCKGQCTAVAHLCQSLEKPDRR